MADTVYLIDFDGTLVDVWQRYYVAYTRAAKVDISFHDYVSVKRDLEQDTLVAEKFGTILRKEYVEDKKCLLESGELLAMDTLLLNDGEIAKLLLRGDVYIFTKRRDKQLFLLQLEKLGLSGFRDGAIVVDGSLYGSKLDYLKSNFTTENVVVVGDSEDDAQCSLLPNVKVYLVATGLRNPNNVKNHEKCRIVNSLSDVRELFD